MNEKKSLRTFIIGFFALSFIIIFHEFGHFIAAQFFGVQTPIFSFGFGPALLQFPIGNITTFQIALLPFGGYVSLDPEGLAQQSYLVQMIIMLAGIACNLLLAYLIFLYLSIRGTYQPSTTIAHVHPDSPAADADLQEGDTLIALDNTNIENNVHALVQKILDAPGQPLSLTFKRNNELHTIAITPAHNHPNLGNNIGWIGIELAPGDIIKKHGTLKSSARNAKKALTQSSKIVQHLFSEHSNQSGIVGPIGIMHIAGESLSYGVPIFLLVIAFLSVNIAFFNLLPIPFLDGGHILMLTIEKLFGATQSTVAALITRIIFFMLLAFLAYLTLKDIQSVRKKKRN